MISDLFDSLPTGLNEWAAFRKVLSALLNDSQENELCSKPCPNKNAQIISALTQTQ